MDLRKKKEIMHYSPDFVIKAALAHSLLATAANYTPY